MKRKIIDKKLIEHCICSSNINESPNEFQNFLNIEFPQSCFYSMEYVSGSSVNVTLENIINNALKKQRVIMDLGEYILAKNSSYLYNEKHMELYEEPYFLPYTEENIGIDRNGVYYEKGEKVIVVIHRGGLITPERIEQAHNEDNELPAILYTEEEFDTFLACHTTKLTKYNKNTTTYNYSCFKNHGIIAPFEVVKDNPINFTSQDEWINNPLVQMRTCVPQSQLKYYFDIYKDKAPFVTQHDFTTCESSAPYGYLLTVHNHIQILPIDMSKNKKRIYEGICFNKDF